MIFLNLLFIMTYLSLLFKGGNNILNKIAIDIDEYNIKKTIDKKSITADEEADITIKSIAVVILGLIIFVLEIIFFIKALKIDIYLYPTIIMIILFIVTLLKTKMPKKYDLTTEEGRFEKRKEMEKLRHRNLKSTIFQLIDLGYYCYIFYILVFLNR